MRFVLLVLLQIVLVPALAQVTISEAAARHFLEQDDRVKVLEQKDSVRGAIIADLRAVVVEKDAVIETYKKGIASMSAIAAAKDEKLKVQEGVIEQQRRQLKKERLGRWLERGGIVIVLIILI